MDSFMHESISDALKRKMQITNNMKMRVKFNPIAGKDGVCISINAYPFTSVCVCALLYLYMDMYAGTDVCIMYIQQICSTDVFVFFFNSF